MCEFPDIKSATQSVYERHANGWNNLRDQSLPEAIWLDPFIDRLPKGGALLDLGCGTGAPIAKHFIDQGFNVTGLDYAPTMIDIAQRDFPNAKWIVGDIRALPRLAKFDGIYSWDGFFHLSQDEQLAALPRICALIKPVGCLMLTIGPEAGEATGHVGDDLVYHASLSPSDYQQILKSCGCHGVDTKYGADNRCVLVASRLKRSSPRS